ncbi:MAG: NADH-quinone oxidoreductase subunit H, partial [Planctomycetes bacterium]|nr:NADH-quinone oxidoreductase subunit H [Planctomycetota bacterium]
MIDLIVIPLLKIVFVLTGVLITVMYLVLLERKIQAWVQVRLGPMRVGPHGILQPIADVLKLFIKEDITPARADRWVYTAAPIVVLVPALIAFAVVPFGTQVNLFGKKISLAVTDVNVGLL